MTREKILKEIFGEDIKIEDLKLGDLIYLKESLDERVKTGALGRKYNIKKISDLVNHDMIKVALKEGYKWKDKPSVNTNMMSAESVLYLDCLARLNEIHVNMSYIGLNPLGKV